MVDLPGLDEDGGEHEAGAEATDELKQSAGAGGQVCVQEHQTRHLQR